MTYERKQGAREEIFHLFESNISRHESAVEKYTNRNDDMASQIDI